MRKKTTILISLSALIWAAESHSGDSQLNGIQPFATASVTHDSNVFRLPDGADTKPLINSSEKSDTIRQIAIGAKAEIPVSRQRIAMDVRLEDTHYAQFGFLDHKGEEGKASWLWQFGNHADGHLSYRQKKQLAGFAYTQSAVKDLVTDKEISFRGNLRVTPDWVVYGEAGETDTRHGSATRTAWNREATVLAAGARYTTHLDNSVSWQFKQTRARYPNRQFISGRVVIGPGVTVDYTSLLDNQYTQNEIGALFDWRPGFKIRVSGNLGRTSLKHEQLAARDFSGATWRLGLDWTPRANILFNLSSWKDIAAYETLTSSYYTSQGESASAVWMPTEKIRAQLQWSSENLDYQGDPGFALGLTPQRRDTLRSQNASVTYKPLEKLEISIAYNKSGRYSTIGGAGFSDNTIFVGARLAY